MKIKAALLLISVFLLFEYSLCYGQIEPSGIFSDNMVLQRETPIVVWGSANPGERITVSLGTESVVTLTDSDSQWKVELPSFAAGGPYVMTVEGDAEKIWFNNILIGDVWFASGQSNMEHPIKGWEWIPHSAILYSEKEIVDSDYPEIRLFAVPRYPSPVEQNNLSGGKWELAGPESVAGFSSTAWFFGKELYHRLKIPIGIIHSSWGGSSILTWMSHESLEEFKDSLNVPDIPEKFDTKEWSKRVFEYNENNIIRRNQMSYAIPGLTEVINDPYFDDSDWEKINLTDEDIITGYVVWLRKKVMIPSSATHQKLELNLGFLNRQSNVFFNGTELGYFQYPQPVKIDIPSHLVYEGENILTIRLSNQWGSASIHGEEEQFYISGPDDLFHVELSNSWKSNNQLEPIDPASERLFGNNPSFLFNGMVSPVIPYGIKGFIWDQGGSDARRPFLYEKLFQSLIADWRELWGKDDLPFLFIQSTNTEPSHEFNRPGETRCLLREAQREALQLPNTGMVVSIDIGDPYDVHPKNKQVFGYRMALQALKVAYDYDVVSDGPFYESHEFTGDTVIVRLRDSSGQIRMENIERCSFEVAGCDGIFSKAEASLKDNIIYLTSIDIKNPVYVRYAWADNPCTCIFNEAGLPLAPFRAGY